MILAFCALNIFVAVFVARALFASFVDGQKSVKRKKNKPRNSKLNDLLHDSLRSVLGMRSQLCDLRTTSPRESHFGGLTRQGGQCPWFLRGGLVMFSILHRRSCSPNFVAKPIDRTHSAERPVSLHWFLFPSAYLYRALARLILCFWPPLSVTPRSPTSVLSPCGRMSRSGFRLQHSITMLYLNSVQKVTPSINPDSISWLKERGRGGYWQEEANHKICELGSSVTPCVLSPRRDACRLNT